MRTLRNLVVSAAVLLVAPALPGAAGAHVEMSTPKAPAGKPVKLGLEVGHGCDGAATTRLVVEVPARAVEAKALPTDGWKARNAGPLMIWIGGPLADHDVQVFPFRATLTGEKGQKVTFKAIQQCEGGASTAWIQPASGGTEPEHPAPTVRLTSTAYGVVGPTPQESDAADQQDVDDEVAGEDAAVTGEPTATDATADESSGSDDDGDGKTLLLLIVAGLAIGTIAGLVIRARRSRKPGV